MLIEKGVSIPGHDRGHLSLDGRSKKYPFEEMVVGDSFLVQSGMAGEYGKRLRSAVSQRNNRNNKDGKRFVVRSVADGFRCWRVE